MDYVDNLVRLVEALDRLIEEHREHVSDQTVLALRQAKTAAQAEGRYLTGQRQTA